MADESETLVGIVDRLNCQKPTFCAGYLSSGGRKVSFSVKGYCSPGDTVTLTGEWQNHPKYGRQFSGRTLVPSLPLDAAGLVKWMTWNVLRVGPVTAQRLVDEFGIELLDRCGTDPEAVAIYGRLPVEVVAGMAQKWQTAKTKIGAVAWLAGHGLTQKQAEAVYAKYGPTAADVVRDDQFQLLGEVDGFGWIVTDALAKAVGVTGADPRRMRGAVVAAVRENQDKGSTCANVLGACNLAADKIGEGNAAPFAEHIADALQKGQLVRFGDGTDETDYVATPAAYKHEAFVWKALAKARDRNPLSPNVPLADLAERYRRFGSLTFDDTQMAAVTSALMYRISTVCGGAGSGKTSIIQAIIKVFEDCGVRVLLAAPTGKAARRMSEVTGCPASTIHRLLRYNGGTKQFEHNELAPLDRYVIICDEVSMTDSALAYYLFAALGKNSSLVLVGDPNQLPPVGAGSLLRDIITHDLAPVTQLAKCHRQAGPLKFNCAAILDGRVAPSIDPKAAQDGAGGSPWMVHGLINAPGEFDRIVKAMYERHFGSWGFSDPLRDVQFMTAKHEGVWGTKRINLVLQHLHQTRIGNPIPFPEPTAHEQPLRILPNDKVIQTRNDYTRDVMNGETGVVLGRDLTHPQLMAVLGLVVPDDAAPGDLLSPILPTERGRATVCPVCVAGADLESPAGWCPVRCRECGTDFVATDGTPRPEVAPERGGLDFFDDGTASEPARRKKLRETEVVADFVVKFPDRTIVFPTGAGGDLQLAYCLSAHKAQGSQWPCAVVVCVKANRWPQNRSWLYTATTRATRASVILGDRASIDAAAQKVIVDERVTILDVFARCDQAKP